MDDISDGVTRMSKMNADMLKMIDSPMFKCYNANAVHYFRADVM